MLRDPAPVFLPTKSWPVFLVGHVGYFHVSSILSDLLDDQSEVLVAGKVDGGLHLFDRPGIHDIGWITALRAFTCGIPCDKTSVPLRPQGLYRHGIIQVEQGINLATGDGVAERCVEDGGT